MDYDGKKILPLGSVVTLENGDGTQLMIIARATVVNNGMGEVYYDYGGDCFHKVWFLLKKCIFLIKRM